MDIIQFSSLYISVSLYRGFFKVFSPPCRTQDFPLLPSTCLVPEQIQHKADFYKHNVMKDKGARLFLKSVILPFTPFSSSKEILIMKSNCEKQVISNQVFLTMLIEKWNCFLEKTITYSQNLCMKQKFFHKQSFSFFLPFFFFKYQTF